MVYSRDKYLFDVNHIVWYCKSWNLGALHIYGLDCLHKVLKQKEQMDRGLSDWKLNCCTGYHVSREPIVHMEKAIILGSWVQW